jgi:hypothetical protein
MKYKIADRVKIIDCPNVNYIGVIGTVEEVKEYGAYHVKPEIKPSRNLSVVIVFESEIVPA